MKQSKLMDWMQPEKLKLLEQWTQTGQSEKQVAERIGISAATLKSWKTREKKIAAALTGKCAADSQVENALLKRALGYTALETTYECVRDEEGNEKMVVKKQVEKQVPPDLSAQTFWLKNRHPEKWRSKPETEEEKQDITVQLTED